MFTLVREGAYLSFNSAQQYTVNEANSILIGKMGDARCLVILMRSYEGNISNEKVNALYSLNF